MTNGKLTKRFHLGSDPVSFRGLCSCNDMDTGSLWRTRYGTEQHGCPTRVGGPQGSQGQSGRDGRDGVAGWIVKTLTIGKEDSSRFANNIHAHDLSMPMLGYNIIDDGAVLVYRKGASSSQLPLTERF